MKDDSTILMAFFCLAAFLIGCITWDVDRKRQADHSADVQQLTARVEALERILAKAVAK